MPIVSKQVTGPSSSAEAYSTDIPPSRGAIFFEASARGEKTQDFFLEKRNVSLTYVLWSDFTFDMRIAESRRNFDIFSPCRQAGCSEQTWEGTFRQKEQRVCVSVCTNHC